MKFNERLLDLRKKKGWSQEELGYKLDVSRQTISKWESGQTTPELEKLRNLAKIFEISVDELISEDDENNIEKEQLEKDEKTSKKKKSNVLKLIFVYLSVVLILFYIILVAYRYSIIVKIYDCFWGMLDEVITHGYYMEKRTFGVSLNIGNPMTKEEHFYYNNCWTESAEEKVISRVKIKKYDGDLQNGADLINSNRTIYVDMLGHFCQSDETNSKTTEFDEVNKTYKIVDNYDYASYYNLIMSEYENVFNTLDYNEDWTNYFRYAMNLGIDINKTKEGDYYMSNEKLNAPIQKDNAYIIINENKIIFEKIIYDDEMKSNYTGTRYKLKVGTIDKEDVAFPNIEEYTEVKE